MKEILETFYNDIITNHSSILNELENLSDKSNAYCNYLQELMIMNGIIILSYDTQIKIIEKEEFGCSEIEKSELRIILIDELISISGLLADKEMARRKSISKFNDSEILKLKEINLYNYFEEANNYIEKCLLLWSN